MLCCQAWDQRPTNQTILKQVSPSCDQICCCDTLHKQHSDLFSMIVSGVGLMTENLTYMYMYINKNSKYSTNLGFLACQPIELINDRNIFVHDLCNILVYGYVLTKQSQKCNTTYMYMYTALYFHIFRCRADSAYEKQDSLCH